MSTVVRMPAVLAGATEAAIQNWLVAPGQSIRVGEPLAEVETEKAVVEYAAEIEGTVLELLVSEGQPVAVGEPIAVVGGAGEAVDDDQPASGGATEVQREDARAVPEPETAADQGLSPAAGAPAELSSSGTSQTGERRFASPIVRRLARERRIDLAQVVGSGPGGRIVRRDLDALTAAAVALPQPAAAAATQRPTAPAAQPGVVDVPLSGMRRAIARRLTESKSTIPHFYMTADCRADALLDLRRRLNAVPDVRVSVNDLVVKALAGALLQVPDANAIWAETSIRRFSSVDVAVAVALDDGLVTPVLRGVESLSITQVSTATAELVERAKAGRLKQHELEGGAFSISNLGMYGVTEFSAILNPPQAGILAVGAATQRPVVVDGALAVGTVMTVTLSADHRVIDGALAARLLAAFVGRIEEPLRILL